MRLLLATLAASLCLVPAAQAQTKIQPGAMLQTEAGQCTLNFVFDGLGANAGKTYIGTAAHCGDRVGQDAMDVDDAVFGRFAFLGNADDTAFDYAFIEVAPDHVARVDPAMKGHPEYPTGFTSAEETTEGDLIQMSGYGLLFGETQPTQEQRQTVLQSDDAEIFTLSGPSVNGDSGGPFVHIGTGKALGIVSQYGFTYGATDVGPTVDGVLAKAAKAGFPVALRAAGQPAPAAPKAAEPQPAPAAAQPAPATASSQSAPAKPAAAKKPKKAKKSKRQVACEKKAKKTKSAKKRKAALKRCAKRR
jgi:hypothetical protein